MPPLERVVGGHAAVGAGGAAGGGGDDHAAAVAGHVVRGGDRAQVVAAEVGGDHAVEELDVGLEHVLDRVADLAGVAEHHVQAAERVERRARSARRPGRGRRRRCVTAIASPPAALICSATALALSPSMSQTTTFAPSRA